MSQIPRSFKIFCGSVTYLTLRGLYYYPYLENRDNKYPVLYSTYIFQTILGMGMFPVAFPIIISTDIQLIERRMRNIPLDRFDNPFPYIGCVIKSEYTKDGNVIKEMQNITNDK